MMPYQNGSNERADISYDDPASLYEKLKQYNLERYFAKFISAGVKDLFRLSELTLQDYEMYGISTEDDCRRLHQLIQKQRVELVKRKRLAPLALASNSLNTAKHAPAIDGGKVGKSPILGAQENVINSIDPKNDESGCAYAEDSLDVNTGTSSQSVTYLPQLFVCVRKRPLSQQEKERRELNVLEVLSEHSLMVHEPKIKLNLAKYEESHTFNFDRVFDDHVDNEEVYKSCMKPFISSMFCIQKPEDTPQNFTCFVYGQTGSGKTYTLFHPAKGLYVFCALDIFSFLESFPKREPFNACITMSFYEIYQGRLYDLLNQRKRVHARQDHNDTLHIAGLTCISADSLNTLQTAVQTGLRNRITGTNGTNTDSSRSHAVLTCSFGGIYTRHCKISFIDLAGSERASEQHRSFLYDRASICKAEGSEINKSLLALKECIRAMTHPNHGHNHVPFRSSKLTHVLKDALLNKHTSRTCMIATVSPSSRHCEHSLNTLKYASLVQSISTERKNQESVSSSWDADQYQGEYQSIEFVRSDFSESSEEDSENIPYYTSLSSTNTPITSTRHRLLSPSMILSPISKETKLMMSPIPLNSHPMISKENTALPKCIDPICVDQIKEKIVKSISLLQIHMKQSRSESHLTMLHDELERLVHKFDEAVSSEYL